MGMEFRGGFNERQAVSHRRLDDFLVAMRLRLVVEQNVIVCVVGTRVVASDQWCVWEPDKRACVVFHLGAAEGRSRPDLQVQPQWDSVSSEQHLESAM
jgi:hypothetical protein